MKQDLKYRGHEYFKPSCPLIQVFSYLKFQNKFFDFYWKEDMFKFCDITEIEEENESITEKIFQMEKK